MRNHCFSVKKSLSVEACKSAKVSISVKYSLTVKVSTVVNEDLYNNFEVVIFSNF